MEVEKIKILGAILEVPAKQHCQFGPAMGAKPSSYMKFIATHAP